MLRIKDRHVLAYAVRGRRKYKNLYTPQKGSYAEHYELVPVWIVQMGANCRTKADGVRVGSKCLLLDAYELEHVPYLNLTEYPVPKEAVDDMEDSDGRLEMNLIHEDALMGICYD